jgi:hypothetical protein
MEHRLVYELLLVAGEGTTEERLAYEFLLVVRVPWKSGSPMNTCWW